MAKRIARTKIAKKVFEDLHIVVNPKRYVNFDGVNVMINIEEVDDIHLITKEEFESKYHMSFSIYHAFKDDIREKLIEIIVKTSGFDKDHILFDYRNCIINDTVSIEEKREAWENSMSYRLGFECEPCSLEEENDEEIWLI